MKTQTIVVELRAAEGGEDSKLLVKDMAAMYIKAARNNNFVVTNEHWKEGLVSIWLTGNGVKKYFQNESGGHRWQRVPPTERKGRVHTSTITVAVLEQNFYQEVEINTNELQIETTRGSGAGGQHKNVTDSCVVITHIPTGIKVVRDGRNQHKNKEDALEEIKKRVNTFYRTGHEEEVVEKRNGQIGNGERSDKKRTYREKDDRVIDHETGKSASLKQFMRGKLELLIK